MHEKVCKKRAGGAVRRRLSAFREKLEGDRLKVPPAQLGLKCRSISLGEWNFTGLGTMGTLPITRSRDFSG